MAKATYKLKEHKSKTMKVKGKYAFMDKLAIDINNKLKNVKEDATITIGYVLISNTKTPS
ncbi:MAG: hypothetical protein LC096_08355 [Bacteroidia bacterium]|nr:hypothetical protein [Bacteroidia bacterium]